MAQRPSLAKELFRLGYRSPQRRNIGVCLIVTGRRPPSASRSRDSTTTSTASSSPETNSSPVRNSTASTLDRCTAKAALGAFAFGNLVLAVRIAGREHSESFGTVEDWEAHQERIAVLQSRVDELYGRITKAVPLNQLRVEAVGNEGLARLSFAITGGEVPVVPVHDAGARLVDWFIAHEKDVTA